MQRWQEAKNLNQLPLGVQEEEHWGDSRTLEDGGGVETKVENTTRNDLLNLLK